MRKYGRTTTSSDPDAPQPRVLVAEDDASLRNVLVLYLRRRGLSVDEALDGAEALQFVEKSLADGQPYAVIVSDIRMPNLTGDKLLEAIRQHSEPLARRVILMTGYAHVAEDPDLLAKLATPLLQKPFALEQLSVLVQQYIDQRSPDGRGL
jgi:CheY-like chemotaxis protein